MREQHDDTGVHTDFLWENSPLARAHRDDPRLAEKWDLVIFGLEQATAYSEPHRSARAAGASGVPVSPGCRGGSGRQCRSMRISEALEYGCRRRAVWVWVLTGWS